MVDTRRAPATASINSAHAHLGDKLSELYHILWRNVDSVRTTVPREGKRSFESTRRYRSSSTRQSGPRQFHRKVSKQWFSNHHSFILPFLFKRRLEMSFFLSFFYFSTSKLFHHHRIANLHLCKLRFLSKRSASPRYSIYSSPYSAYSLYRSLFTKKVRLGL